jgi:hypothetical protein
MIRSIFVIMSTLAFSGCTHQTVNLSDIQTAIKACGSFENIVEIEANYLGSETALCIDRTTHFLNADVWKVK